MAHSLRKNREQGFTMIELLAVIVIIGILAAIAIPTYSRQVSRANDSSLQSFVTDVLAKEASAWKSENPASWTGPYRSDIAGFVTTPVQINWNIFPAATKTTTGGKDSYSDHRFCITAYHVKGMRYTADEPLRFDSKRGGIVNSFDASSACTSVNSDAYISMATTPPSDQITVRANDSIIQSGASDEDKQDPSMFGLNIDFTKGNSTAEYTDWYLTATGVTGSLRFEFKKVLATTAAVIPENTTCRDNPQTAPEGTYYFYDGMSSTGTKVTGETVSYTVRVCKGSIIVEAEDDTESENYVGLYSENY